MALRVTVPRFNCVVLPLLKIVTLSLAALLLSRTVTEVEEPFHPARTEFASIGSLNV